MNCLHAILEERTLGLSDYLVVCKGCNETAVVTGYDVWNFMVADQRVPDIRAMGREKLSVIVPVDEDDEDNENEDENE